MPAFCSISIVCLASLSLLQLATAMRFVGGPATFGNPMGYGRPRRAPYQSPVMFDFGLQRDFAARAYGLGQLTKEFLESPYGPGKKRSLYGLGQISKEAKEVMESPYGPGKR